MPDDESDSDRRAVDASGAELDRLRHENLRLRGLLGLGPTDPLPEAAAVPMAVELPLDQPELAVDSSSPLPDRVRLFRSLFRGRPDVHALRWTNSSGQSGYVPAVAGGWRKDQRAGSRRYLPLSDEVIARHLAGQDTVGLYPLLEDDRCWLVAADFDGPSWRLDATAYQQAARDLDVGAYLERSRSGEGGHVWIFFTEPVPAADARRLGTGLVRSAIDRRAELGLDSYDRLFPSQDLLPRGSFGNLIALPLQGDALTRGNSLFLDPATFEAVDDQWHHLAGIRRVTPAQLDRAIGRLAPLRTGQEAAARWKLPKVEVGRVVGPVRVTVDARLRVDKAGLPTQLLAAMKHLASVANPEFHKKQRLRLSTWHVPRVVRAYDEDLTHLHLPRGVRADLDALAQRAGTSLEVAEVWPTIAPIALQFRGVLTDRQLTAVDDLVRHDLGMLVAPPGAGKTIMACALIAARQVPTLVLVYRKPLLEQWRNELATTLGLDPDAIGQIGGGRDRPTGAIDLATVQTLARRDDLAELARGYGLVVVDECHHVPAVTVQAVVSQIPARHVLGLTATPYRQDGLDALIAMECGPVRHQPADDPALPAILEVHQTTFQHADPDGPIQQVLTAVADDDNRTRQIARDIAREVEAGRRCLVLTERKAHLSALADQLRGLGLAPLEVHGSLRRADEQAMMDRLDRAANGPLVIVATGQYIGEGFDCPPLDTLFVTFPISYRGKVVQYVGRIMRPCDGKTHVIVHDYLDVAVPVLTRMHDKRRAAYRALGLTHNDDQPQLALEVWPGTSAGRTPVLLLAGPAADPQVLGSQRIARVHGNRRFQAGQGFIEPAGLVQGPAQIVDQLLVVRFEFERPLRSRDRELVATLVAGTARDTLVQRGDIRETGGRPLVQLQPVAISAQTDQEAACLIEDLREVARVVGQVQQRQQPPTARVDVAQLVVNRAQRQNRRGVAGQHLQSFMQALDAGIKITDRRSDDAVCIGGLGGKQLPTGIGVNARADVSPPRRPRR